MKKVILIPILITISVIAAMSQTTSNYVVHAETYKDIMYLYVSICPFPFSTFLPSSFSTSLSGDLTSRSSTPR